jgi:hypothetical protein
MRSMETAMETDGDGSGGTSPSRQGAGTETSIPQNLSSTAAALRNYSGKNAIVLGFSVPRLLIGEKAASEVGKGGLTIGGRGQGLRRPLVVRVPSGPPPAPVWSSSFLWAKLEFWSLFHPIPRIFPV